MEICVIGAGYVGLVTSAALAYFGNQVTTVESNSLKLKELKQGKVPFFEPHLEKLVHKGLTSNLLKFTENLESAVKSAQVIFIAVGTPSGNDGEPDLTQIKAAAKGIGTALDSHHHRLVINKSTVPVGSGNWVEMLVNEGMAAGCLVPARTKQSELPSFSVVSNPEFLREGTAIADTLYPDRVVVGVSDQNAMEIMKSLYHPIIHQTFEPPEFLPRPKEMTSVPFVVTDVASAELIKYCANAFLAMKISFANEMANLCERLGVDIQQVMHSIGLDKRIGTSFLNAGVGWGGSCFGKDLQALIQVAKEYNCPTKLLEATISVNKQQRLWPINKLQEELKIIKGRTIGLLGLSFKPNTDDLRDAPSLTLAAQLIKMGARINAYDPVACQACAQLHPELGLVYCKSIEEAATNADALVLVTEWKEFLQVDWIGIHKIMRHRVIIDGRNFLPRSVLEDAGFTYKRVG